MKVAAGMDEESLELLEDGLRKTMLSASGPELDAALADLGWADMLTEMPEHAIPLVFRLLGETGSQASVLVDVVLHATGNEIGDAGACATLAPRLEADGEAVLRSIRR